MDKSVIIHMIIRAPSKVSPHTFVNFVYLYVNKQFTTQIMLKVAPNVGHNVKNIFIRSWKLSKLNIWMGGLQKLPNLFTKYSFLLVVLSSIFLYFS
jgi:hypothetical protein